MIRFCNLEKIQRQKKRIAVKQVKIRIKQDQLDQNKINFFQINYQSMPKILVHYL